MVRETNVTVAADEMEKCKTSPADILVVQPVSVLSVDFCALESVGGAEATFEVSEPGKPE